MSKKGYTLGARTAKRFSSNEKVIVKEGILVADIETDYVCIPQIEGR